ncbi:MAG: antibiotic biosynthesis monooxygenase, partial [Pseudomonadota bacterium]
MVHVVAVITAKPGLRGEVLEAFQANVPAVHAEDGCIEYGATVDTPDAGPIQTEVG